MFDISKFQHLGAIVIAAVLSATSVAAAVAPARAAETAIVYAGAPNGTVDA